MTEIVKMNTEKKGGKKIARKNTTVIAKCDCISEYQDKVYGNGMRVKNSTTNGMRCTVCSKTS